MNENMKWPEFRVAIMTRVYMLAIKAISLKFQTLAAVTVLIWVRSENPEVFTSFEYMAFVFSVLGLSLKDKLERNKLS